MANQTEINLDFGGGSYTAVVHHYQPYCPMRVTGSGMGDADPPSQEEIDFTLYFRDDGTEVECAITLARAEMRLLDIYRKK